MSSNIVFEPCNQENMIKFISALRGGKYHQCKGILCEVRKGQSYHCCLGVACRVAVKNGINIKLGGKGQPKTCYSVSFDDKFDVLPKKTMQWLGLQSSNPSLLIPKKIQYNTNNTIEKDIASRLNDAHKFTFREIADCFEHTYIRNLDE